MRKNIKALKEMFQTVYSIDKKSIFICIIYNLIKQLMNVFYGVYFVRLILEAIETDQNMISVILVLLTMLIINIMFNKFNLYYQNIYLPNLKLKIDMIINEKIVKKANEIPYDIFNSPSELNKYNFVIENTSEKIMSLYKSFGTMCGLIEAFVMILYYIISVDVFAILLSAVPLLYSYLIAGKNTESKHNLDKKVTEHNRRKEYANRIHTLKDYVKELKSYNISSVIKNIYHESVNNNIAEYKKDGIKIAIIDAVEMFFSDAASIVLPVLYLVIRMMFGASYLMGDFIGITQAISTFSSDVEWMMDVLLDIKSNSLYINDYLEYVSYNYYAEIKCKDIVDIEDDYTIEFINVKYQYPGKDYNEYAINDISLTIKKGERIAVVGENGAGKTTFISLIVGLINCSSGQILLNGKNIDQYDKDSLRSFFGVVLQDYKIYPLSVKCNVEIDTKLSNSEILDSIKKIGLNGKIESADTIIGKELYSEGIELSGGEKQKLAIVRILANKFPFIILDEPTSAIDAISEQKINSTVMNAIENYNPTLLFISHKLSTTELVDRILVFENGKITEDGNHKELMTNKGLYYKLYKEQKNMYEGTNYEEYIKE